MYRIHSIHGSVSVSYTHLGTPYDGLYDLYVQAQIHYADGDMTRWNNAMALWNRGVEALQAETLRKMGKMQTANCLRLC